MSQMVQYPGAGCVVEFMQGNAAQIAWVMEEQGGKLRLLLPNRRETSLTAARLLPWSGPQYASGKSREDVVRLLGEHKEKRDAIQGGMDARELWEMAQGEVDKASAQWFAELTQASPDVDTVAACGHALLECKSHFKFQPPEFEVYTADMVDKREQAEEAAREREVLVGGGQAWLKLLWDTRQARKPGPDPEKAPPEPVRERLKRMILARILDPESTEDEALWKMVAKGLPDDPHLALHLATSWGLVPEHYNYWLARADYEPGDEWAGECAGEIDACVAGMLSPECPLAEEDFISIDSASTRDIDDAFHIEPLPEGGWLVSVALASPAWSWPFGSELDKLVASRATSLYLPEGNYHMMPQRLGTESFSLHAGQECPSLRLRCRVDAEGMISDIRPDAIRTSLAANLNYPDCEAVLDGTASAGNPAMAYAEQLERAHAMARVRLDRRVRDGAVIIERPDADFYLVGEGKETTVYYKETVPAPKAQFLVSEIMILTNAALAEWALAHEIPLFFRTQDVSLPPEFAGVWTRPEDIARVVKSMVPASLDTVPRPHAGMGLKAYATVSSPLRRYPDLLNEAQILHFLREGRPRWTVEQMEAILPGLNIRLDAAGLVQRFRPRYWKLLYVQQQAHKGGDACIWDAVVSEVNDAFVSLSLEKEQLFLRGKRNMFPEKIGPGQKLKVRLGKVSPLRGEFSILAVQEVEA